jgi:hypothetical protein
MFDREEKQDLQEDALSWHKADYSLLRVCIMEPLIKQKEGASNHPNFIYNFDEAFKSYTTVLFKNVERYIWPFFLLIRKVLGVIFWLRILSVGLSKLLFFIIFSQPLTLILNGIINFITDKTFELQAVDHINSKISAKLEYLSVLSDKNRKSELQRLHYINQVDYISILAYSYYVILSRPLPDDHVITKAVAFVFWLLRLLFLVSITPVILAVLFFDAIFDISSMFLGLIFKLFEIMVLIIFSIPIMLWDVTIGPCIYRPPYPEGQNGTEKSEEEMLLLDKTMQSQQEIAKKHDRVQQGLIAPFPLGINTNEDEKYVKQIEKLVEEISHPLSKTHGRVQYHLEKNDFQASSSFQTINYFKPKSIAKEVITKKNPSQKRVSYKVYK